MQTEFILQNIHFALNVLAALILFGVCWLYFDAWLVKRQVNVKLFYWFGYGFLALSFLLHATSIESTTIRSGIFSSGLSEMSLVLKLLGYTSIVIVLFFEPLQKHPIHKDQKLNSILGTNLTAFFSLADVISILTAVMSISAALLYLRRATKGLENHLKGISYALFGLALYEIVSLYSLYQNTVDTRLISFVEPFGVAWIISHVILFASILLMAKWAIGYLLKRLQTQLFMLFLSAVILIFLITTTTFTSLLFSSIQKDHLNALKSDIGVLSYALERIEKQTESDVELVAKDKTIIESIKSQDRALLREHSQALLLAGDQSEMTITDQNGVVLMRGHDPERIGDFLSENILFKNALANDTQPTLLTTKSAVVPTVISYASSPIVDGDSIIGTVILGTRIDEAFVEGIHAQTGLELSVFSGETRVATTLTDQTGITSLVGTAVTDSRILNEVLVEKKIIAKPVTIAGTDYNASYAPLIDAYNETIGMISVLRKQSEVLAAASGAVQLTFIMTIILMIFMTIPSFVVAKKIARQLN